MFASFSNYFVCRVTAFTHAAILNATKGNGVRTECMEMDSISGLTAVFIMVGGSPTADLVKGLSVYRMVHSMTATLLAMREMD
jgi:hypothetical protein